ncbi:DUF2094 domain-containing protein [Reinekea forsetii]|nr:DUF2094 domain-containing protein [Reinekea forsetii]
MFGRKQNKEMEEPVVNRVSITGGFGKISSEPDFINIDGQWREVKLLDETLQNLYKELSITMQQELFRGFGILLTGGGDRQNLAAMVFPSEDKAGRIYPFVVFNRLTDSAYYLKPDSIKIAGFNAIENAIGTSAFELESARHDWVNLLKDLPELQPEMDVRDAKRASMKAAEEVLLKDWLEDVVGSDFKSQKSFIEGNIQLIKQLKENRIHRAYHGISFPLGSTLNQESALSFWLQLITAVMNGQQWRPDIVWSKDSGTAHLFVLTKPMTSSSLKSVIEANVSTSSYLTWQDVLSEAAQLNHPKDMIDQWLKKANTNLLDLAIEWYKVL